MTANILTPLRPWSTHRRRIQAGAALALAPLVAVLAACGGSGSSNAVPAASQSPNSAPNPGAQGLAPTFSGASGMIAAASPGTLQVQSATAQNTVIYSAATKFTSVTPGHVAAGDCVTVTGAPVGGSTQALTAASARIDAKVNGTCPTTGTNGGFAGGGGSFGQRPQGGPSGSPSAGTRARRAFASATGTVSSVSGSTILLQGVLRSGQRAAASPTPESPTTITITLDPAAAVTQTISSTSAAAVVGRCARAIGPANSVGAIAARSITISTPGPDGCRVGFGGRGNGTNGTGGTGASA